MRLMSVVRRTLQCVVFGSVVSGLGSLLLAQGAVGSDLTRAKLEVGAAFLKSGDTELAARTFATVLDADPTNWQARSLLTLTHLAVKDMDKADVEIQRLKTMKAPTATVAALERQLSGIRGSVTLRDELMRLLNAGKWQDALSAIDRTEFADPRKRLLRAYVAALRGDFDGAKQLTADGPFADFNASLTKRADEFRVNREGALVALNYLGHRFCAERGWQVIEMMPCANLPPLTGSQLEAWNAIRSGDGKVDAKYLNARLDKSLAWDAAGQAAMTQARIISALSYLSRFVELAPLHPEALRVGTILSFYSGSSDTISSAADRSLNAIDGWTLSMHRCRKFRGCDLGDDKAVTDLPPEGALVFHRSARSVTYHAATPSGRLTSLTQVLGPAQFTLPFDEIRVLRSKPDQKYSVFKTESVIFDFGGSKKSVPMALDFTMQLMYISPANGYHTPGAMFKMIEDVVKATARLLPSATLDYQPDLGGGGLLAGLLVATAGVQQAAGNGARATELITQAGTARAAGQAAQQVTGLVIAELKAQDGKSMIDVALEDDGLKGDLDRLLTLTLQ